MKKQNGYLLASIFLLLSVLLLTNYCKKEPVTASAPLSCNGSGYFYSDSSTRMIFPNAFTPDSMGPISNNTFGGVGMNFSNFSMTIKDLSGTTLFSDTDISQSWDGKNLSGKIVEGYYKAEIRFKNIAGITINKSMDITLYNNISTHFAGDCKFRDMINPYLGFVYPTNEPFR